MIETSRAKNLTRLRPLTQNTSFHHNETHEFVKAAPDQIHTDFVVIWLQA